ncbi:MAG: hypothetical protein IJN65_04645 [Clostridia bacterium]|nr:hypothetical protein [Clostridia bacterium]
MKKLSAILLVFTLLFALAVPSFAANSFVADDIAEVTVKVEGNGTATKDKEDKVFTLTATPAGNEEFKGWTITGKENVDYIIVEGSVNDKVVKIKIANDVTATAVFTANQGSAGDSDGGDTSPESGYNVAALIALTVVSAFGVALTVKKVKA